jgi:hypothetical protein
MWSTRTSLLAGSRSGGFVVWVLGVLGGVIGGAGGVRADVTVSDIDVEVNELPSLIRLTTIVPTLCPLPNCASHVCDATQGITVDPPSNDGEPVRPKSGGALIAVVIPAEAIGHAVSIKVRDGDPDPAKRQGHQLYLRWHQPPSFVDAANLPPPAAPAPDLLPITPPGVVEADLARPARWYPHVYDAASSGLSSARILIPRATQGTVYVFISPDVPLAPGRSYFVEVEIAPILITGVVRERALLPPDPAPRIELGCAGDSLIVSVYGGGFAADQVDFELRSPTTATTFTATNVDVISPSEARVTFVRVGQSADATFDLYAERLGSDCVVSLPGALVIAEGEEQTPCCEPLAVSFDSFVRWPSPEEPSDPELGHPVPWIDGSIGVVRVRWENRGTGVLQTAKILQISARLEVRDPDAGEGVVRFEPVKLTLDDEIPEPGAPGNPGERLLLDNEGRYEDPVWLLALGPSGEPLAPGVEVETHVYFRAESGIPRDGAGNPLSGETAVIRFEAAVFDVPDECADEIVTIAAPRGADGGDFAEAIDPAFVAALGGSWSQLGEVLTSAASEEFRGDGAAFSGRSAYSDWAADALDSPDGRPFAVVTGALWDEKGVCLAHRYLIASEVDGPGKWWTRSDRVGRFRFDAIPRGIRITLALHAPGAPAALGVGGEGAPELDPVDLRGTSKKTGLDLVFPAVRNFDEAAKPPEGIPAGVRLTRLRDHPRPDDPQRYFDTIASTAFEVIAPIDPNGKTGPSSPCPPPEDPEVTPTYPGAPQTFTISFQNTGAPVHTVWLDDYISPGPSSFDIASVTFLDLTVNGYTVPFNPYGSPPNRRAIAEFMSYWVIADATRSGDYLKWSIVGYLKSGCPYPPHSCTLFNFLSTGGAGQVTFSLAVKTSTEPCFPLINTPLIYFNPGTAAQTSFYGTPYRAQYRPPGGETCCDDAGLAAEPKAHDLEHFATRFGRSELVEPDGSRLLLAWEQVPEAAKYRVAFEGNVCPPALEPLPDIPSGTTFVCVDVPPGGDLSWSVTTIDASGSVGGTREFTAHRPAIFVRGDSNGDSEINISDAIFALGYLFQGGAAPACRDGLDSNDDGKLNITDPIVTIRYLFSEGGVLNGDCAIDTTCDELGCENACACE